MNYLFHVIRILPVCLGISSLLYAAIYWFFKNKRSRPTLSRIVCEYVLTGWLVMFLYITQVMSFGNGMGERLNLTPLKPVYLAIKYGPINAEMATQILLNILMFVPLGILLPLVFKQRLNGYLPVLMVSFIATCLTEASQYITGRNADIDDVIANTLGGVLGFALYIFTAGINSLVSGGKDKKPLAIKQYRWNLVISILLVLASLAPIGLVKLLEGQNEFGYVYYGHLQPTQIEITGSIPDQPITANVYKYVQVTSQEELTARLSALSGFGCSFVDTGGNTLQCQTEGDSKVIFIYPYHTWAVLYNYGVSSEVDLTKLPSENEALELAWKYLNQYQITAESVEFARFSDDYGDPYWHLVFIDNRTIKGQMVWGPVELTIGEDGALLGLSDRRTYHQFVKTVETISPRKALDIAMDIGVGEWNGTAYVSEITPSYYFNEQTGYLIPIWQIRGEMVSEGGPSYPWTPMIDATQ